MKKTKIINMTPHPIYILDAENKLIKTIPFSGSLIRLSTTTVDTGLRLDEITVSENKFGSPEGLPDYEEGTYYIVSQMVKSALTQRSDLLVPAEVVRDSNGTIIGCRSLGR